MPAYRLALSGWFVVLLCFVCEYSLFTFRVLTLPILCEVFTLSLDASIYIYIILGSLLGVFLMGVCWW